MLTFISLILITLVGVIGTAAIVALLILIGLSLKYFFKYIEKFRKRGFVKKENVSYKKFVMEELTYSDFGDLIFLAIMTAMAMAVFLVIGAIIIHSLTS